MNSQKIQIKEYKSASITGKSTRKNTKSIVRASKVNSELKVNFLKLSTAMVKANTTIGKSIPSQAYDIILSALMLHSLLDYKKPEIYLKDGFRQKYRDFSRSARTGELAQAINYIFAQEKLGFKFVFDYDEFLKVYSIPYKKLGGTPDYVLFGKKSKNLAVLESKGSSTKEKLTKPQLRAKLQGAMDNQCMPGVLHLKSAGKQKVSNSYASVVELVESSESRRSTIHFADPEYDEFKHETYSEAISNYYFRWILFICRFSLPYYLSAKEAIDILLNGIGIDIGIDIGIYLHLDIVTHEGIDFYVQKSPLSESYLKIPVRYGISKKVIELLYAGDYEALYALDFPAISLSGVEIFSDGTIALEVQTNDSKR